MVDRVFSGVILQGNDISGLFASLLLANYCSTKKIRWIAIGMFSVVLSCLLPAMATLFAEVCMSYSHASYIGVSKYIF